MCVQQSESSSANPIFGNVSDECEPRTKHVTQSHKNPVSASAMLTGKFLRIRKVFATSSLLAEEFPNILKMYEYYTKYPDNMQSVPMNWEVSGQSKKCPNNLENVSG